jgi:hypothetical protein
MIRSEKLGIRGRNACAPFVKAVGALLLCLAASVAASAQINSPVGPVVLSANLPSALTVSATPGLVNFTLQNSGVSNGSSPITITTSWTLATIISRLSLYAYFTSPTSALADGSGHNIPATNVSGSVNGGAFTAFTGNGPFAATSSIQVFNRLVLGFSIPQSRTDTLNLRINTTGLGLAPGSYAGLLVIQAQAI